MTFQSPIGLAGKRERFAGNFTFEGIHDRRELARTLRDKTNRRLFEAHDRVRREQREQRRPRRPQQGATRLSNTDTIARAQQIRGQLLAKLSEIYASDMEPRAREALAADIKMQIDRVEQKIAAIRRRLRAIEAERTRRRDDETPEARRRRWRDMQERRIYIRSDYLYHADDGGLNPNAPPFSGGLPNVSAPVSFNIGGVAGTADVALAAEPNAAVEVIV